jgi:hypothetical protein
VRIRLLAVVTLVVAVLATVPGAASAATTPPAIHHVWHIVLENESESASFGAPGTYLNQLAHQGVYLSDYYATGHVSNDNYIAMLSGQLGNPANLTDCQQYVDYEGTVTSTGVPLGAGCVYPSSVQTLADQLTAAGLSWRGWMEDMGNNLSRETATCGQPVGSTPGQAASSAPPGTRDTTQTGTANDSYAARHNPFVYFHSLIDVPAGATGSPCAADVLPLSEFQASLAAPANFNWITPNLCHDGHDSPCADGEPGGLTSANAFLAKWVPIIEASPAYQQDGLIVITFDEAATTDTSSCCGEVPGTSGVVPAAGPSLGGGKVGAVLLSPLLTPHTSTCAYNHFSLLRTYEDLFGIRTHLGNASVANSITPDLTASGDPCAPTASVPEVSSAASLGAGGLAVAAVAVYVRSRRTGGGRRPRPASPLP